MEREKFWDIFHPSKFEFRGLLDKAIKSGIPPTNFNYINSLLEVVKLPPFIYDNFKSLTLFLDYDGAGNILLNRSGQNKINNTCIAPSFIEKLTKIILWSARINCPDILSKLIRKLPNKSSIFPFINNELIRELSRTVELINPACEFTVKTGLGKLTKRSLPANSFIENVLEELEDSTVTIIGSSHFDRVKIRQIIEKAEEGDINLSKFFYIDTGHLFI